MIYTCKPSKISFYINTSKKSMSKIKAETGCDVIINAGLYDMRTFKPVLTLKKNGKFLAQHWQWLYGMGWETNGKQMFMTNDPYKYPEYITCTEICRDGKSVKMNYDSRGGKRGRSAIGITKNGEVSIICSKDGTSEAMTPETLQRYALNHNWKDGIMLDSGGSSQCMCPNGNIYSNRIVHNYICLWLDKSGIRTYSKSKSGELKLSPNFKVKEFAVSGSDTVVVDMRIVDVVQKIRNHYAKGVNIVKESSYTPDSVGIYIRNVSNVDIVQYAKTLGVPTAMVKDSVAFLSLSKSEVDEGMERLSKQVQNRFGLDNNTMNYLKEYRFAKALLEKLANAK